MSGFALLPGEKKILSSDEDTLVLTNKRIRYDSIETGQSNLVSMTLDSVASCGLITKSNPIILIAAAVIFLFGMMDGDDEIITVSAIVGLVLVIIFFNTKKAVLSIASNGGSEIVVSVKDMPREEVIKFINSIEREKLSQITE